MPYPKKITPEVEEFIKANYLTMGDRPMSRELGISKTAIWKYRIGKKLERPRISKKPKQKQYKNRIDDMIHFAKEQGYKHSAHAIAELGNKEFKQLYVNQLNQ